VFQPPDPAGVMSNIEGLLLQVLLKSDWHQRSSLPAAVPV
jgi:hypothetical protein